MTALSTPVSFIATVDAAASRQFYESQLGLRCRSDDPYALVFDVGDTTLRIQKVQANPAVGHTVLGWEVADIRAQVVELSGRGVRFETFPHLPQDDAGIWHSPSGARVAWFKDPDGNTLSLTQLPAA